MKRRIMGIAVIGLVALITVGCGGTPYVPAFTPEVGSSYAISSEMTSTMSISMMGQSQVIEQGQANTYAMTVREADDFKVVLDVTVEKMAMNMDDLDRQMAGMAPGMVLTADERQQIIDKMIGLQYAVEVTHAGEVLSVDIDYGLAAKVVKDAGFSGPKRMQAQQLADNLLSSDAIKRDMESWLGIYTTEPKKTGETWQITEDLPLGELSGTTTIDFTLTNLSEVEATIEGAVTLSSSMSQGPMNVDFSGNGSGTVHLARGTGWPIDSTFTARLEAQNSGNPGEMSVTVQTKVRGEPR